MLACILYPSVGIFGDIARHFRIAVQLIWEGLEVSLAVHSGTVATGDGLLFISHELYLPKKNQKGSTTHRHRQQNDSEDPFPNHFSRVFSVISHDPITNTELPRCPIRHSCTDPRILVLAVEQVVAALDNELLELAIKIADVSIIIFALHDAVHVITEPIDAIGRVLQPELDQAWRPFPAVLDVLGEKVQPVEHRRDDSIPPNSRLVRRLQQHESANEGYRKELGFHSPPALLWNTDNIQRAKEQHYYW
jgi:hypothetical protein